ncbi:uncharacterized protein CANTADRAFT_253745 [Suhomyces tanzawaensis NRRL Y-17324]|uniref:Uncharacterized protein n=1 Tax=Suhomyces tanzawaensis NRRL Y-17324 TaxID=984487 RepID=A0A1E4SIN3_9ASCO|nr:uncharacterized protein CANTADRAFT_253745 [Suhomyces tanzawaensis NRRL Y-17324]ODV79350.1 hypothetical protein CANTADRAFT_253745 [Suhomyces tanzawaensis NRRL Y-17324]
MPSTPASTSPFPHPYWGVWIGNGPTYPTIEERLINRISYSIRTKPQWKLKYTNDVIASKWRQELREQFGDETRTIEDVINYVFKELDWIDRTESTLGGYTLGADEKILASSASESVVGAEVKQKLQSQANELASSFAEVDYHPGTTNVVDLVHPLLFPLQYGVTPIKDANGELVIAEYLDTIEQKKQGVRWGISTKYQWLPATMTLDESKNFQFSSYINNLHPVKFSGLYSTIAEVFNATVPALDFSLSFYASGNRSKVEVPGDVYPDSVLDYWDILKKEEMAKEKEIEGYKIDYIQMEKLYHARQREWLKPLKVSFDDDPKPTNPVDLKQFSKLKVIVKMANIELTPENPTYPGGSWHVEGSINENIVATVLYYYDVQNITTSTLSFRTGYNEPNYAQDDVAWLEVYYGLKDEDIILGPLESVEALEDRIVVFPNFFQHHVDLFELKDKLKSGHRKILCFFLVDPYDTLTASTEDVPPQQEEW